MTDIQQKLIRSQISMTLKRLGAVVYDIIRTPADANGQPTGDPEQVGQMFGLCYRDTTYQTRVHIDIPGMVTTGGGSPTLTGLVLCGEAPRSGDTMQRGDKATRVISADMAGPLYTLAVEEVIG